MNDRRRHRCDVMVPENWWIAESPEGIRKERDRVTMIYWRLNDLNRTNAGGSTITDAMSEIHRLWHVLNLTIGPHEVETCWDACPRSQDDIPCKRPYR